jgi:hypothetical protein
MRLLGSALVSLLLATLAAGYHHGHGPDAGHDKLGAVASESSICSNIGIDVLKKGGNAADTLVATVLCVGVIGMVSNAEHATTTIYPYHDMSLPRHVLANAHPSTTAASAAAVSC